MLAPHKTKSADLAPKIESKKNEKGDSESKLMGLLKAAKRATKVPKILPEPTGAAKAKFDKRRAKFATEGGVGKEKSDPKETKSDPKETKSDPKEAKKGRKTGRRLLQLLTVPELKFNKSVVVRFLFNFFLVNVP
jgi:hypothetical protein